MDQASQFGRGVELFNAEKFFEAHEAWEELWLAESEPEKRFLQGLIQVAAAFHHHQRGNDTGMRSLLAAGLAKLDHFPDGYRGIALERLRSDARVWLLAFGDELPEIRLAARDALYLRHNPDPSS